MLHVGKLHLEVLLVRDVGRLDSIIICYETEYHVHC